MLMILMMVVGLVFEFVMTGKSDEVQEAVGGFRWFIAIGLIVTFLLQVLLGIGNF